MIGETGSTAALLLDLLDAGENKVGVDRGLALLQAAKPDLRNLEDVTVGDRDRAIWQLRDTIAPGSVEAVWECDACGEHMEAVLPADFTIPPMADASPEVAFRSDIFPLRFPNMRDLRFISEKNAVFPYERLSPDAPWHEDGFTTAAEAALDEADPGMRLVFQTHCAACGALQANSFDVVDFVWTEFVQLGYKVVSDVLFLADAVGWSEQDILSMSDVRRTRYVERLRS